MQALLLNATLKRSPDQSSTDALAHYVAGALAAGAIFYDEPLTATALAGAALVGAGLVIAQGLLVRRSAASESGRRQARA